MKSQPKPVKPEKKRSSCFRWAVGDGQMRTQEQLRICLTTAVGSSYEGGFGETDGFSSAESYGRLGR